jgi:hypothetical protein
MLEVNPGQMFDTLIDSLTDRTAARSVDMNNLFTCSASGLILPSATITTYGASLTLQPPGPHKTLRPFSVHGTVSGIAGGETVTFRVVSANEDGLTPVTITLAITTNGPWAFPVGGPSLPANSLVTLFTTAKKLVSLACAMQSSIGSSAARANAYVLGLNGG